MRRFLRVLAEQLAEDLGEGADVGLTAVGVGANPDAAHV
jgi:hypothetical protein